MGGNNKEREDSRDDWSHKFFEAETETSNVRHYCSYQKTDMSAYNRAFHFTSLSDRFGSRCSLVKTRPITNYSQCNPYDDEEASCMDNEESSLSTLGTGPRCVESLAMRTSRSAPSKTSKDTSDTEEEILTPPRLCEVTQPCDIYSLSPLSLMNRSLSSSESDLTPVSHSSKQEGKRNHYDEQLAGVFRRKSLDTVAHNIELMFTKEGVQRRLQHSSVYLPSLSGTKLSNYGSTKIMFLAIICYSTLAFLMLVSYLEKVPTIDVDSQLYDFMKANKKTMKMREIPPFHEIPDGFARDFPSRRGQMVSGASNPKTIRRSLGGLYPIHHTDSYKYEDFGAVKKRSIGLGDLDIRMYDVGRKTSRAESPPRVLYFYEDDKSLDRTKKRRLDFDPTPFSDNTQLYGILSSDDEALQKMEVLLSKENEECPSKPWHHDYNPSCNGVHELDLVNLDDAQGRDTLEFKGHGYWRNAWRVDLAIHNRIKEKEVFILKTAKYNHNFEHAHFEHDRVDALAMSELTFSPHVINIYSFCGRSVFTEFAGGPRPGTAFDKAKKIPLKRLEIARDIATGLSHVHYGRRGNEAQMVHFDINPANVVFIDKDTVRINDFNIAKMIERNATSGEQCDIPSHKYPNFQWRSPEEAKELNTLSEKADVFSLGHIFYRIICGHEPWNKNEAGGRPSAEVLKRKVIAGKLPRIPSKVLKSKDPEVVAIREAMLMCYIVEPTKRPSSREVANFLKAKIDNIQKKEKQKY